MTDQPVDIMKRLCERKITQNIVDAYQLSKVDRRRLSVASNARPARLPSIQRALLRASVNYGISWRDLVFYVVVMRKVAASQLIPELGRSPHKADQDFVVCCESRRFSEL